MQALICYLQAILFQIFLLIQFMFYYKVILFHNYYYVNLFLSEDNKNTIYRKSVQSDIYTTQSTKYKNNIQFHQGMWSILKL